MACCVLSSNLHGNAMIGPVIDHAMPIKEGRTLLGAGTCFKTTCWCCCSHNTPPRESHVHFTWVLLRRWPQHYPGKIAAKTPLRSPLEDHSHHHLPYKRAVLDNRAACKMLPLHYSEVPGRLHWFLPTEQNHAEIAACHMKALDCQDLKTALAATH